MKNLFVVLTVCLLAVAFAEAKKPHHQGGGDYENVAVDKVAWQSSNYGNKNFANRAVDGNTNSHFGKKTCTETAYTQINWWAVDLLSIYAIDEIVVYNRAASPAYLGNFEILAGYSLTSMKKCAYFKGPGAASQVIRLKCKNNYARFVKLVNHKKSYLTLCEVQVWGSRVDGKPEPNLLSLHMPTRQSSNYAVAYQSQKAVDGDLDPVFARCASTKQQLSPWWQVDLGDVFLIDRIVVYNRAAYGERLTSFQIDIQDKKNGKYYNYNAWKYYSPSEGIFVVKDYNNQKKVYARYVRISLPQIYNYLTLCEVRVYGWIPK